MTRSVLMATAAVGFAMLPLGAADAQTPLDWSGGYVGIHAGYLWGEITTDEPFDDGHSVAVPIAGGLAGYNFPMMSARPVQFGVEADFGIAGTGNGPAVALADEVASYAYDLEWDAHFRVRAGMTGGTVMPFVAAGLALAHLGSWAPVPDATLVGGTVGGGIDFKLGPKLVGRVEGLYDWYGGKDVGDFTVDFHAFTARAALILRLP
jgi:outer membrane immunogenic protein